MMIELRHHYNKRNDVLWDTPSFLGELAAVKAWEKERAVVLLTRTSYGRMGRRMVFFVWKEAFFLQSSFLLQGLEVARSFPERGGNCYGDSIAWLWAFCRVYKVVFPR